MYHTGQRDRCAAALHALLGESPNDAAALTLLGQVYFDRADVTKALHYATLAIEAQREYPGAVILLARLLMHQGRHAKALDVMRRGCEDAPIVGDLWVVRAHIAADAQQYDEAIDCYGRALTLGLDPVAMQGLAQVWSRLGQVHRSVEFLQGAARQRPTDWRLAAQLAFALNYVSGVAPLQVTEAHKQFGRCLTTFAGPTPPKPRAALDPLRRLRVGLISGDFRTHPVTMFIEPILQHRDAERFEYIAYTTTAAHDEVTDRFKTLCTQWRSVLGNDESQASALVLADRPDILIDLAGLTAHTGVWLLRSRLAPVQMTYLGYPNTTGIARVDYRLVDSHTDPIGSENLCTEQLLRLDPCMHCYTPPDEAPPVRERGDDPLRPVRFASYNVAAKISSQTLDLWAAILAAVPGSILRLKSNNVPSDSAWSHVLRSLKARGVDPSRVEPTPRTEALAEHLAMYHDVDIALDTTPYNGTTTTCEALLMGVPVVALWGDRHAARVSGSLLSAVGCPELIASTPEAYVRLAEGLAGDASRLTHYRTTLRPRLLASPLCDGPAMARRFEGALRRAWQAVCTWGIPD